MCLLRVPARVRLTPTPLPPSWGRFDLGARDGFCGMARLMAVLGQVATRCSERAALAAPLGQGTLRRVQCRWLDCELCPGQRAIVPLLGVCLVPPSPRFFSVIGELVDSGSPRSCAPCESGSGPVPRWGLTSRRPTPSHVLAGFLQCGR